jgi:hypothetical protein
MISHRSGIRQCAAVLVLLVFAPLCSLHAVQTQIAVEPSTLTVTTPASFTLNVAVNNVTALHAASITCVFDPTILNYAGAAAGSFLTNTIMMTPRIVHGAVYDSVVIDQSILGSSSISGSGVIVVLTFTPLKGGITPVALRNTLLLGGANYATTIPATVIDGEVIAETTVPVTVSSFAARFIAATGAVCIEWSTLSEIDNYGFEIDRRAGGECSFVHLPGGSVAGNGSTLVPHSYAYVDTTIPGPGRYEYRLRQIDNDGTEQIFEGAWVDVVTSSVAEAAPADFALEQNYPNPFNPRTTIGYRVEGVGIREVRLAVYDMLGREVAVLVNRSMTPGSYEVHFDGSGLSSGTYICRLTAGERVETRKMVLVR